MKPTQIEIFKNNKQALRAFIRKQNSAPTVTLFGPTSSAKSTLITEVLPPESNKLLGYNVGDVAQTTLIRLCLMLNSRLEKDEAIIKCIPYTDKESVFLVFVTAWKKVLSEAIYRQRDELEDMVLDQTVIKDILNPTDKSFHVYEYAKNNDFLDSFASLAEETVRQIICEPELFDEEADRIFKQRRKEFKTIKKIEIYEELFDRRFSGNDKCRNKLRVWFDKLNEKIFSDLEPLWSIVNEEDGKTDYILYDKIIENGPIEGLIRHLYNDDSACSMVFEEVQYITSPSEGFIQKYKNDLEKNCGNLKGRNLKINIVDTVGLTQISEEKDVISDAMDKILERKSDAYLFLCSADEKCSVYDTCINLMYEKERKERKFGKKPVIICRTKADLVLRNIMVNSCRKETGKIQIEDGKYADYLMKAYAEFIDGFIKMDAGARSYEHEICGGHAIEFVSMAPDYTKEMSKVLTNGELESSKVFRILNNVMELVDDRYSISGQRPWLYSDDFEHYPLNLQCTAQALNKTIGAALVTYNTKQKNQYIQYVNCQKLFHWNSVYCFYRKLSWGSGHETNASSYENFKLYLKNMVAKWLREIIPRDDIINNYKISFAHLYAKDDIAEHLKETFPGEFRMHIENEWIYIIDRIAKNLTYDAMQPDLDYIYNAYSYDTAFRESLKLFDKRYSDESFWEKKLLEQLTQEFNAVLQKMYVYDEV